jgi:hypothetical protein
MKKLILYFIGGGIILLFIIYLFAYKQPIWEFSEPINAERFAHFAAFVSAVFGMVTVIFLYFTFKQTRKSNQSAFETLNETKKNSIDSTFFNLLRSHQSIVEHLHQRITTELRMNYSHLDNELGGIFGARDDKDFFELLYRTLHLKYRRNSDEIDRGRIGAFFNENDWVMGHYFRSLIHSVLWIDSNKLLSLPEKAQYIVFLRSNLSLDELRLTFYYVISRDNVLQRQFSKLFNKYAIFDPVQNQLIQQKDKTDWLYFQELAK